MRCPLLASRHLGQSFPALTFLSSYCRTALLPLYRCCRPLRAGELVVRCCGDKELMTLWSLFGFFCMYIGNEWLQDIILGNCFLFIINNFPLCGWKWKPSAVYGVADSVAGKKKKNLNFSPDLLCGGLLYSSHLWYQPADRGVHILCSVHYTAVCAADRPADSHSGFRVTSQPADRYR